MSEVITDSFENNLNSNINETVSIHTSLKDFSDFKVQKVLSNNTQRKTICLQGSFKSLDGTGIVLLEKTAFEEGNLTSEDSEYFSGESTLKKHFHNDIYGNYDCFPKVELNAVKTTIIHPATEKHIEKYSVQNIHIIDESPVVYQNITKPYVESEQFDLQWVYNILEHKSEAERIVFEDADPDNGFILLPDLKWNGTTLDTLYLLAITHKRDLKSIRDLTGAHLNLLRNILNKGKQAIEYKYGVPGSQLRIYLHYQPSFYHLHVHFTYLRHEAPGITAERAHLLSNVISNIEVVSDYYQRATIPFTVQENSNLFKKFEENGLLTKLHKDDKSV